ncbi:MAG TPA: ferritin family protein [bacterium]|nr:ferritin family protein [Myxococcales bacterium]OQA61078.1 MAG: putative trifunctional 2-polyprenylphenol hydroxylase/glutamate synthase subunit beta/ferritin domain-containing protein [bacterium ADurb.Bin270]HPW44966.1 ferritin family protein [bacterium]HQC50694.1 ferritin family protein [bacterium]HQH79770.1 ferritin family protein [bacterium]
MQKNFASELIAKAIEREEDAHRLYSQAANLAQKPEVKKLFEELASQELDHKETLKKIDPSQFSEKASEKTATSNIASLVEPRKLNPGFSIQDALIFAIKREEESYRFYTEFAELAEDEKLKNIFFNLAAMEMHHKNSLEDIYDRKIAWEN